MNNSTGGNTALKEELRFLQKLFGKNASLKIFCGCEYPICLILERKRYRGKKLKLLLSISQGFHCFLSPVSNKLLLKSIEICFTPNTIKTE